MKKRYIISSGILFITAAAICGCGSKRKEAEPENIILEATATPVPEKKEETQAVEMKKDKTPTPAPEHFLGKKAEEASVLKLKNNTGLSIKEFYIRLSDQEWGEDLLNASFEWKEGETVPYYYTKEELQDGTTYDLRVVYSNSQDPDENLFRYLELTAIDSMALCLTDIDGFMLPYAVYKDKKTNQEVSTKNDVLTRLGMSTDYMDEDEVDMESLTDDDMQNAYGDETDEDASADESVSDEENDFTSGSDDAADSGTDVNTEEFGGTENVNPGDSDMNVSASSGDTARDTAQSYIGQDIAVLINDPSLGTANGHSTMTDADMGAVGYYYYDTFTVFTSIDENGDETISQVW